MTTCLLGNLSKTTGRPPLIGRRAEGERPVASYESPNKQVVVVNTLLLHVERKVSEQLKDYSDFQYGNDTRELANMHSL